MKIRNEIKQLKLFFVCVYLFHFNPLINEVITLADFFVVPAFCFKQRPKLEVNVSTRVEHQCEVVQINATKEVRLMEKICRAWNRGEGYKEGGHPADYFETCQLQYPCYYMT